MEKENQQQAKQAGTIIETVRGEWLDCEVPSDYYPEIKEVRVIDEHTEETRIFKEVEEGMEKPEENNGDGIRSMSNEDLAFVLMCPYDTAGETKEIMPCVKETGTMELAKPGTCYQCILAWLNAKKKGEK